MLPTVVSEGCAAVILLPSLRINCISSPANQEGQDERGRRTGRLSASEGERSRAEGGWVCRTRVAPAVVRDEPAQQPQGLPSHVLRAALTTASLQSLHEALYPPGQLRALRRGTRHLHHNPPTCRNLDCQTTAFHFQGERDRLPFREACLSLISVSPPTSYLDQSQTATASRREVTAGSGLLGVCALIGTAVQTQASPVAMGIASGDPALRPGGVAFLFPGPVSGFPPVVGLRTPRKVLSEGVMWCASFR